MIRIRKGMDLPLAGAPEQKISSANPVRRVALLGGDYPGMRPTLHVAEGDRVKRGQLIFDDKKTEGVRYTAPAAGRVVAINRGAKRFMQSVVIDTTDGDGDQPFEAWREGLVASTDGDQIRKLLIESGQWTAIRTRPFGQVPAVDSQPDAIFVPAMDTNPLAPDPEVIISEQPEAFRNGLRALSCLTEGPVWLCRADGSSLESFAEGNIREESFAGPHPAGNPSTHIHFLHPVSRHREVWVVGYQDVIAIGKLLATGKLYTDRVVALCGPRAKQPRLVRTRLGAAMEDICRDEMIGEPEDNRVVSGSVFNGHHARGPLAFLSRLANQVTILREGNDRRMFGYLSPGLKRHSAMNIYLSKLWPGKRLELDTSTNGSERAMVPLGQYEKVMPLDILPTQLLRSLIVGDIEMAESLGALELVEEDLALCTYVCVGKYEYGPILRDNLERIQKEG
ncbi:MAG: Na(+)-translocating NADH-quinone reductase subunit A [Wenzhouxiangella sp.]|nr:Na(+)-translocating NADH-quinone reductase subunit A [Wenzhouxiangella sp.]TVR97165.1 MAG: Na(+)-translocating NADH-quinone reductase subunit A [Wenzhouxiangellaceae bacterium]